MEDVFSRMIVGWSLATHLRASLATEALEMAVWRRGVAASRSRGSCTIPTRPPIEPGQYTSVVYTERLAEHGIAPSVGTVGDSVDCDDPRVAIRSMRGSQQPLARVA